MASVAILRFTSVIKFSRSKLHTITDCGCMMATLFNVRTAANLKVGRGELKNNCRTEEKEPIICTIKSQYWYCKGNAGKNNLYSTRTHQRRQGQGLSI